ncbi:hypothetical protein RB195_008018 [Necator americanus]|uniref:Uncharacterized protein n=1 Tax=Necator americanus TaxID=51031 RepID=A0ABR1C3D1_NECAM
MDGEDVMMISVEETPGTSNDEPHETSVSPRRSSDLHRSEDEFGMDQPSTSELKLTMQPTRYPDAYLQEILLSSPAHLFSCGLLPPEHLTASWEQWLCYLASSLTPHQWQSYWAAHAAVFGLGALPVHLCSFFNRPMVRDEVVDRRHLEYEVLDKSISCSYIGLRKLMVKYDNFERRTLRLCARAADEMSQLNAVR